jgi:hypothetical protein
MRVLPLLTAILLTLAACDSADPGITAPSDLSAYSQDLTPLVGSWRLIQSTTFGPDGQSTTRSGNAVADEVLTVRSDGAGVRVQSGVERSVAFRTGSCESGTCQPNSLIIDGIAYPFGTDGGTLIVQFVEQGGPENLYVRTSR